MTATVIFPQLDDPYMLGRILFPDYHSAACYVMEYLPPSVRSRAVIEESGGGSSRQPQIRMHYEKSSAKLRCSWPADPVDARCCKVLTIS